jgi:hypothetical protein
MKNVILITWLAISIPDISNGQLNVGNLVTKDKYLEIAYSKTNSVIYVDLP